MLILILLEGDGQVGLDVANISLHTTDIGAPADTDVAALSPGSAPGVADHPEVKTSGSVLAVSNQVHGMVQGIVGIAAVSGLIDARPDSKWVSFNILT